MTLNTDTFYLHWKFIKIANIVFLLLFIHFKNVVYDNENTWKFDTLLFENRILLFNVVDFIHF